MIKLQKSFAGGMNVVLDDTRIGDNQYRLAFNIRNRFDSLTPIKKPLLDSNAPAGLKQGIVTFLDYCVVFVAGRAYYRQLSSTAWTQIAGFSMSETAPRFYTEKVPASTLNFTRTLASANDVNTVNTTSTAIPRSTQGLIVQDGINQPWIIFPDATARRTSSYAEWNKDSNREYVPIGTAMAYFGDILYVAIGDALARSLTGRPLDFVLNIDTNGNKAGDATTTSVGVGFSNITAVRGLNSGQLLVSNSYNSILLTPDRTAPFFGEPRYKYSPLFGAGCVNQHSLIETRGDYAMITPEGLRSFNAVLNLNTEAVATPFSLQIEPIFKDILQTDGYTCAEIFDGYAIFGVKTIYGYVQVIYDTLNEQFVSLDQTDAYQIKQMASMLPYQKAILAITDTNVYQLFASVESDPYPLAIVITKSWTSEDPRILHKPQFIRPIFANVPIDDEVFCTLVVDGRRVSSTSKPLQTSPSGVLFPAEYPVLFDEAKNINPVLFVFNSSPQGWKTGAILKWSNGATLTDVSIEMAEQTPMQANSEKGKVT